MAIDIKSVMNRFPIPVIIGEQVDFKNANPSYFSVGYNTFLHSIIDAINGTNTNAETQSKDLAAGANTFTMTASYRTSGLLINISKGSDVSKGPLTFTVNWKDEFATAVSMYFEVTPKANDCNVYCFLASQSGSSVIPNTSKVSDMTVVVTGPTSMNVAITALNTKVDAIAKLVKEY